MDKERDAIKTFYKKSGEKHIQKVFDCDAQLFRVVCRELLFTVDEYSAEDFFIDDDPFRLGWNLAVATMSDILAGGGIPIYYAHSMTIPASWDQLYLERFGNGIRKLLSKAGAEFIGGDTGFGASWKYTGIALGKPVAALSRAGATDGDIIFMTGKVGAGNLEAAVCLFDSQPEFKRTMQKMLVNFPYRDREAAIIRKYASSCTDSSDGLLRALLNFSQSSQFGFVVNNLPYLEAGLQACRFLDINKTLLFMGECGEYELVFTIPEKREKAFLKESSDEGLEMTRIGMMTGTEKYLLDEEGRRIDFKDYDLHGRNYKDKTAYLNALSDFLSAQIK